MEKYSIVHATDASDASNAGVAALRREFDALKRRETKGFDFWDEYFGPIHLVLAVIATLTAAIWSKNIGVVIAVLFGYLWIPGMIVTMIVAGIPFLLFEKSIGRNWSRKRFRKKWYVRYKFLETEIPRREILEKVEKEGLTAESERVRIENEESERKLFPSTHKLLDQIRPTHSETNGELMKIHFFFNRKKKWYDEYRTYEIRLAEIIDRGEQTIDELEEHQRQVPDLPEKLGLKFTILKALAKQQVSTGNRLLSQLADMRGWTASLRTRKARTVVQGTKIASPRPPGVQETRSAVVSTEPPSVATDVVHPPIIQQPIVVAPPPPPQRRVLNRVLNKIPFEDYVGAAKAKMTIGELGEVIVLHYEIRRVEAETRISASGRVTRVSEYSDSLGYDIESLSQGEKVFIEVKSTSGGCWTDFFLSANERKVMDLLGEKYWLYRIFDLSKEDGSAKLSIFRGKTEIEASLELEPVNFKMKPKIGISPNGVLPFETLE